MALIEPSVLANTIMSKLYDVLTNGDDTVPPSDDNFFSWCTPGIPIEPADLEYLTQGLTGVVKKSAVDAMQPSAVAASGGTPPPPPPLTPEQLADLMAKDTSRLYMQAENMARLLDFVPDVAAGTNEQFARLSVQNNDGTLSDIYDYALRMSQVMKVDLPPETVEQIKRLNGLLQKTVKSTDIITGEETECTVPSDLVVAYNAKMAAYSDAALEYNARRIDALTATDSRAVHDWAINADIYRNKVKAALADWETAGHKTDFEKIAAFFEQVGRRDMALLKQGMSRTWKRHDSPRRCRVRTSSSPRWCPGISPRRPAGPDSASRPATTRAIRTPTTNGRAAVSAVAAVFSASSVAAPRIRRRVATTSTTARSTAATST